MLLLRYATQVVTTHVAASGHPVGARDCTVPSAGISSTTPPTARLEEQSLFGISPESRLAFRNPRPTAEARSRYQPNLPGLLHHSTMNLHTATALAAAAVLAFASSVHADACDSTTLVSLTTLASNSAVTQCASDSGYSFSSLTAPTTAEMDLMCTSTSCQSALEAASALNIGDCTVNGFSIQTDLIEAVVTYCAGSGSNDAETGSSSTDEDVAATVAPADDSASTDDEVVATIEPVTNTTSSASEDTDVDVGDSDSGSDFTVETPEPTSAGSSASEDTQESASSAGSDTTTDSGSSAAMTLSSTSAVLGSAVAASVLALFL